MRNFAVDKNSIFSLKLFSIDEKIDNVHDDYNERFVDRILVLNIALL